MSFQIKLVLAATALALGACSSVKLEEPTTAPVVDRTGTDTPGSQIGGKGNGIDQGGGAQRNLDPLNDPTNLLYKRSIYFAYDEFTVAEQFKPLVEAHARFLMSNPNRRVQIEGNTDDRGSREYNIALGQKRADAVKGALRALGVAESQMETVSFGEEKPHNPAEDEASRAENRRADIIYR